MGHGARPRLGPRRVRVRRDAGCVSLVCLHDDEDDDEEEDDDDVLAPRPPPSVQPGQLPKQSRTAPPLPGVIINPLRS